MRVHVYGDYEPDNGAWWCAAAECVRCGQASGVRRLIGAGPSVRASLSALRERLGDPYEVGRKHARGGWDTNVEAGQIVAQP